MTVCEARKVGGRLWRHVVRATVRALLQHFMASNGKTGAYCGKCGGVQEERSESMLILVTCTHSLHPDVP